MERASENLVSSPVGGTQKQPGESTSSLASSVISPQIATSLVMRGVLGTVLPAHTKVQVLITPMKKQDNLLGMGTGSKRNPSASRVHSEELRLQETLMLPKPSSEKSVLETELGKVSRSDENLA